MPNNTVIMPLKETTEVLTFAIEAVKSLEKSMADDKFELTDIPNFFPALFALFDAIEDIEKVKIELEAATQEEADVLKTAVKAELKLNDEETEEFINEAFAVAIDLFILIKKFANKNKETENDSTTEPA